MQFKQATVLHCCPECFLNCIEAVYTLSTLKHFIKKNKLFQPSWGKNWVAIEFIS